MGSGLAGHDKHHADDGDHDEVIALSQVIDGHAWLEHGRIGYGHFSMMDFKTILGRPNVE